MPLINQVTGSNRPCPHCPLAGACCSVFNTATLNVPIVSGLKKPCWVRAAEQKAVKEGTVLVSAGSSVYHNTPEKKNSTKITGVSNNKKKNPQNYIPTEIQFLKNPLGNKPLEYNLKCLGFLIQFFHM